MKKLLSLLLSICMAASILVGCGAQKMENPGNTANDKLAETESITDEVREEKEAGEPEKVVVRMVCLGTVPSDLKLVEDAINKISVPEINVQVELEAISIANYDNQLAMDMTSGEQVDVFYATNYNSLVSNKQLLDITDYIGQYGQGLVEQTTAEWLKATSVGGRIYAVPVINGKAMTCTVAMRTDILEKYNITPELTLGKDINDSDMQKNLEELNYVFEIVKENEPDMITLFYPVATAGFTGLINYDSLTDGNGVLMGEEGWNVVDLYETDEYYQMLELARKWYNAGYIKSDAATDKESEASYMSAGRLFASVSYSEVGLDAQYKASTGYDYTCVKIKTPLLTSSSLSGMIWGVSSTTKVPEASVKFLDLAYTNKDVANLMCYGVQDVHWILNDDGTVSYPEGIDNTNSPYPSSTYWAMPNSLVGNPLEGNPSDYNEILAENNKTAPVSRALGFTFDQSNVTTQCAAVSAVLDEYLPGFKTGSLDLEQNYSNFIEKLKAAGMDDIIAEKQKQLDAWCTENGINK